MRTVFIALTALFLLSDPRAASAQNKQCLHDQLETQANRARREKALELAEDINRAQTSATHKYVLSPPDMDEATAAVLDLVDLGTAFGPRGTTGLSRVQAFVTGYSGGLAACR